MPHAGEMDRRIQFIPQDGERDLGGLPTDGDAIEVWAGLLSAKVAARVFGESAMAEADGRWFVRYREDIDPGCVLLDHGRRYRITVVEFDRLNGWTYFVGRALAR